VDLLKLNNSEFHVEFENAARVDQNATIVVLHFINDCERRKSYLDLGYSSVWDYCVRKLEYSSSTAARYIQAARCIGQNAEVLGMLEKREVNMTSICQFASILDENNKEFILSQVKGASWRDVERVARKYRPPVELRDRMVHVQAATPDGVQDMVFTQFLAPNEYAEVFDDVRNLLPGGTSYGDIALTVLREFRNRHSPIEKQKRREKKGSASLHSHRWEFNQDSHRIPDVVRDVILIRDGGQCTFVAPDGTQCQCRKDLQVDHIQPVANDGPIDMANLRLLCGGHNRRAAEPTMGMHVMAPYWRRQ
jgi:hypothetical protein